MLVNCSWNWIPCGFLPAPTQTHRVCIRSSLTHIHTHEHHLQNFTSIIYTCPCTSCRHLNTDVLFVQQMPELNQNGTLPAVYRYKAGVTRGNSEQSQTWDSQTDRSKTSSIWKNKHFFLPSKLHKKRNSNDCHSATLATLSVCMFFFFFNFFLSFCLINPSFCSICHTLCRLNHVISHTAQFTWCRLNELSGQICFPTRSTLIKLKRIWWPTFSDRGQPKVHW